MRRGANYLFALLIPFASLMALSNVLSAREFSHGSARRPSIVLYDGGLGNLPADQGFDFLSFPTGPTQNVSGSGTVLDTMATDTYYAGYFAKPALVPELDRSKGFTVTFTVSVMAESHSSSDRAGFSVIVLSDDQGMVGQPLGIELGFWTNEIWAQDDDRQGGNLFTHAEGVAIDTTSATIYQLAITGTVYALQANGSPVLTGRLRDYSNSSGIPDPYETPNLLFLGDDTASASARIRLDYAALEGPWFDVHVYLPLAVR